MTIIVPYSILRQYMTVKSNARQTQLRSNELYTSMYMYMLITAFTYTLYTPIHPKLVRGFDFKVGM